MDLHHASASVSDEDNPPPVTGVNEKAGFGRDRLGASDFWSKTYKGRISCLPSSKDAWEDEVTAIAYQFSDAKSRLNAFSSIYSIPDEALAYIFELLVSIFPVKANDHKWGWVSVTHVSRHFRAVALDHASLWSTLNTDGDTPWNIFLPRSRQTRLVIKVNPRLHRGNGLDIYAAEIIQNLGRVQTLNIGRINFVTYTWLKSCFLRSAPQLQTLRLEVYGQYFSTISNASVAEPGWPALDHQFLTQGAPDLRDLSMTGMQFPWYIKAPIPLRSLVLDFWSEAQRQCTFVDIIRCLENMPLLQDLALWRALPVAISTDTRTRIKLPHLRLLFLADECSRCLALWSSLDIPPTCSIRIETEELEAEDEHHLPEILKDHLAKPHIPSYVRAHVGHPNEHQPYNNMIRVSLHSSAVAPNDPL
ncbi:hypothetical protein PENSPDRAFT_736160 [Peniophora sp. CONT]|nr:hypothetical protein PENSPDRAFT_736160 [Peniophora sp. CONT]